MINRKLCFFLYFFCDTSPSGSGKADRVQCYDCSTQLKYKRYRLHFDQLQGSYLPSSVIHHHNLYSQKMAGKLPRKNIDAVKEKAERKFDSATKKASLAMKTSKNFQEEIGVVSFRKSRPAMSINRVIINNQLTFFIK